MRSLAILLLPLVFASTSHAVADSRLACEADHVEAKILKQAPNGARRIGKHTLEVKYSRGVRRFVDKGPHGEGQGEHWYYCGYDARQELHLIGHLTEGLYSGSIVFEETGQVLRAGQTVIISSDKKNILAVEQLDGVDGKEWSLLDISGRRLWKGYAGIIERRPGNSYDSVAAEFTNPEFGPEHQLTATTQCAESKKLYRVTLINEKGTWKWLPANRC